MSIKRTKRQRVKGKPREVKADGKAACAACGTIRKIAEFGFEATAMFDAPERMCNLGCYQRWCADREAKALGPWGDTPERVAERRKQKPKADVPQLPL